MKYKIGDLVEIKSHEEMKKLNVILSEEFIRCFGKKHKITNIVDEDRVQLGLYFNSSYEWCFNIEWIRPSEELYRKALKEFLKD